MTRSMAVFILTHGRPTYVRTLNLLARRGYRGKVYLVLDNEDETVEEYRRNYGHLAEILLFDKDEIAATFDTADLRPGRGDKTVVYARNAAILLARDLGYEYMVQLDDDYGAFSYRAVTPAGTDWNRQIDDIDQAFERTFQWLDDSSADIVAWSQGGDHLGGAACTGWSAPVRRKAMNALFLRSDTDIKFLGRINEDVNTYVVYGGRGRLFLTAMRFQITQTMTQQTGGGMTEAYLYDGTYVKSFATVVMAPSCTRVGMMAGTLHARAHHRINWRRAVPVIISDRYRKAAA